MVSKVSALHSVEDRKNTVISNKFREINLISEFTNIHFNFCVKSSTFKTYTVIQFSLVIQSQFHENCTPNRGEQFGKLFAYCIAVNSLPK